MPKILIYRFLQFFFYTQDLKERGHLHVVNNKSFAGSAKIWFENGIEVMQAGTLSDAELKTALRVIESELDYIFAEWSRFKNQEKTRTKTVMKIRK